MEQVSIDRVVLQCENWSLGHMNDLPTEAWKYFPAVALPGMITVPNMLFLLRVPVSACTAQHSSDGARGQARMCPGGLVCAALFKAATAGWPHPEPSFPSELGASKKRASAALCSAEGARSKCSLHGTGVAVARGGREQHITPTRSILVSVVGSHLAATSPRLEFN